MPSTSTQESTGEIQGKIAALQRDARLAVEKMLTNRKQAEDTINLTSTAGNSLQAITQAVANISEMSHQIARAAEEQSGVANVVSKNIANISHLAEITDRATQCVSEDTETLSGLADTLRTHVARFKI